MAENVGMRLRRSIWYTQAQINLVCARAGHFGMRMRMPIWYAQAQVSLICADAGQIFMRTRSTFILLKSPSCVTLCLSGYVLFFVIIARLQSPEAEPLVARTWRERSSRNSVRCLSTRKRAFLFFELRLLGPR